MKNLLGIILGVVTIMTVACDKGVDSFSLLSAESSFKQGIAYVPRKIDILWLVDSSGSMQSSQQALADNFRSFITEFQNKNFDFNMAVADTGGYLAHFYNNSYSRFRDGTGSNRSGVFIMNQQTPNLEQVFMTNVKVGINGTGDERAFTSFEHALTNPLNAGFLRPGAYLVIIIVSDEDDFSHNDYSPTKNYYFTENYNDPKMFSIPYYVNFLTNLTGSTAENALNNFTVHNISILDTVCLNQLKNSAQKVAVRYKQLSDATGGISASLCDDMGAVLDVLSQKTVAMAAQFVLDREPWPNTIVVTVDGVSVPQSSVNGWTYEASTLTIAFHGSSIPAQNQNVRIFFEPKAPQQ